MISDRSLGILQELINIGVGKGAQVLNTLLSHHVVLSVPVVTETTAESLVDALGLDKAKALSCVQMGYRGSLQGEVQLLFPSETASQMVSLIIGESFAAEELDFIRQATLTEVGNIVINAVVGTLSNLFGFHLQYTLPIYRGGTLEAIEDQVELEPMQVVLLARTQFLIQDLALEGNMVLFFSMPTYRTLEDALEAYVAS
jgi:chemotaxis protein CheC